jgi:hypothetical protein
MIGKKIPLLRVSLSFIVYSSPDSPEAKEEDGDYDGQHSDMPTFGFLIYLHQAVGKGRYPQKPFQKGSKHYQADYCNVYDLRMSIFETRSREFDVRPLSSTGL